MFHVAFFDEGGFKAVDVWESPEAVPGVRRQPAHAGHRAGGGIEGEPNGDVHAGARAYFNAGRVALADDPRLTGVQERAALEPSRHRVWFRSSPVVFPS